MTTLGWDQKVVDAWSGFPRTHRQLTRSLRVRDLLGMGSGIGEPDRMKPGLHFDSVTAAQLLQSVVNLPVVAVTGGRDVLLREHHPDHGRISAAPGQGASPVDLAPAWAAAIQERLFGPVGMTGARLSSDPRGEVEDFATGNGFDLRPKASSIPFAAIGA